MKDWEVIGWIKDGAPFCDGHKPKEGASPIFADDEGGLDYCDTCLAEQIQTRGK
jgi:hypothetical protein